MFSSFAVQAAIVALKKTWLAPVAVALYATISVAGWKAAIGPEGVAAFSALLGVTARWFWFRIAPALIWREYIAAPITAAIFATTWPKIVADQLGAAGENAPQVIGWLTGMFGLAVVGFVFDTLSAYRKVKQGSAP